MDRLSGRLRCNIHSTRQQGASHIERTELTQKDERQQSRTNCMPNRPGKPKPAINCTLPKPALNIGAPNPPTCDHSVLSEPKRARSSAHTVTPLRAAALCADRPAGAECPRYRPLGDAAPARAHTRGSACHALRLTCKQDTIVALPTTTMQQAKTK